MNRTVEVIVLPSSREQIERILSLLHELRDRHAAVVER